MKGHLTKKLLCVFILSYCPQAAEAQIKPRPKQDTVLINANQKGEVKEEKTAVEQQTTPTSGQSLIDDIQRDINKQNQSSPPDKNKPSEAQNTVLKDSNVQRTPFRGEEVGQMPQDDSRYRSEAKPTIIKYRKEKRPLKPYKHELQVETGAFFNQLFRVFGLVNEGDPIPISPYLLGYKYLLKRGTEGSAFRIGLGGIADKVQEQRGGFADKRITDTLAFSGRVGYEFQRRLDESWVWTFGADFHYSQFQRRINADSGFDQAINTHTGTTSGFGFVLGFRWDFAPRLSIGSEMSLIFLNSNSKVENIFTANPQFNNLERQFKTSSTKFYGPANIYLSLKF